MLPARRNKVDISVRTSPDPKPGIPSSIARLPTIVCDPEGTFDTEGVVDSDLRARDLIFIGYDRGGAEALSSVWQASHSQEFVEEDARSPSLNLYHGIRCTLTSHDMQDRKYFDSGDYALSKAGKAPQNTVGTAIPNPEKYVHTHPSESVYGAILTSISSIPHVSPNPVPASSNPHISVQISPVNSPTSPAKESSLSQESTLADIMSTDPSPPDTTVETKSTTVAEPTEAVDPANVPTQDTPETEPRATGSGSGDSDVKME